MPASGLLLACLLAPPPATLLHGGCGGAYFLAPVGELEVCLTKRDRHRSGAPTALRAVLFGPDRQVLADQTIPFDGGPRGAPLGEPQSLLLRTTVSAPGVYGVNVTVSNDRYGDDLAWGLTTNCPRFVIETSRGHRDARHEEPLVFRSPEVPADVWFRPPPGALKIELAELPAEVREVTLSDAAGRTVLTLPVADHRAAGELPADPQRAGQLWRLHLPQAYGVVQCDGLTRWASDDALPDHCLWSPSRASWFDWPEHRWLLTPYRQQRFAPRPTTGEVTFNLRNLGAAPRRVALAVEPGDPALSVAAPPAELTVPPRTVLPVTLRYTAPATGSASLRLRATPVGGEFSTWSSLTVTAGQPPAVKLPLQLRPYDQVDTQFGDAPTFPTDPQPYVAPDGTPYVRTARGLSRPVDGVWQELDLNAAVVARVPAFDGPISGAPSPKVAFDRTGGIYLLASSGRKLLLCHSSDRGRSFRAYVVPSDESRSRGIDFEQFSGHNLLAGPPPLAVNTAVPGAADPKLFWRRVNELTLVVPTVAAGGIEMGQPVRVSGQSLGLSGHSGMPSSLVSRGDQVHIIWGEATDPAVKVPGVPTYVATYDRQTRQLSPPAFVGHGAPANDVHNTPSLTMDSQGYLHTLTGTHGAPFLYCRSSQPNSAAGGFTAPEPTGHNLPQTYIGLVCGADDTLHLVYRLNRRQVEPYPLTYHTALTWQRKRPGQPWEAPQLVMLPPFGEYSIYYHRLTIAPRGELLLSCDYWSTFWFYRNDLVGRQRCVLTSANGGDSWRLWDGVRLAGQD
ncbi:MAG: BNR-4 repeat-containing protein [Fimbriimonadaceae bacterium]|nr:BNR-4 repeat-containing protein [Fimbriimonadaceae bacterium]